MQRLHFSIHIDAPREKVWKTMLEDRTYRIWTAEFSPGSYYAGDWSPGSKITFLGPGEDGKLMGMVARIKENRPHEFISIEHLGMVEDGVEDTTSEKVKAWAGALENYTFVNQAGRTEVKVDQDVEESHLEMFQQVWPKALRKLKELAEA